MCFVLRMKSKIFNYIRQKRRRDYEEYWRLYKMYLESEEDVNIKQRLEVLEKSMDVTIILKARKLAKDKVTLSPRVIGEWQGIWKFLLYVLIILLWEKSLADYLKHYLCIMSMLTNFTFIFKKRFLANEKMIFWKLD